MGLPSEWSAWRPVTSSVVLVFLFVLMTTHWSVCSAAETVPHFCSLNETFLERQTTSCSNFQKMALDGYDLDTQRSNLSDFNSHILNTKMIKWSAQPSSSPPCVFYRTQTRLATACCPGWKGEFCKEPVCSPECINGGFCVSPSICQCVNPFVGLACEDDSRVVNNSVAYCYSHSSCSGPKAAGFGQAVVRREDCCKNGVSQANGWGLTQSKCESCISGQVSMREFEFDKPIVVPNTPDSPLYRTCTGDGPNRWRTMDGYEFVFAGKCAYTLYNDGTVIVTVDMANCTRHYHCVKELTIRLSAIQSIVACGSNISVSGQPVIVNVLHGYAPPFSGFILEKIGNYFQFHYGRLRVEWDEEGKWKIFVNDFAVQSNVTRIKGMCGSGNGNPFDDLRSPSGSLVQNPTDFGNSWASGNCLPAEIYQDPIVSSSDENIAKEYCSIFFKYPFSSCHSIVSVDRFFTHCVTDYCSIIQPSTQIKNINAELNAARCDLLSAYSQACAEVSGRSFEWRNTTLCPARKCPPTMRYTECVTACPRSCSTVNGAAATACGADSTCRPGCECPKDMYLTTLGNLTGSLACVRLNQCQCAYHGRNYAPGSSISIGCNTCRCNLAQWNCTTRICAKMCTVLGYQHFQTFDGLQYTFHGPECDFVLVENQDLSVLSSSSGSNSHERGKLTISYSVDKCITGSAVSCTKSLRVRYIPSDTNSSTLAPHSYDVTIDRNQRITVNGRVIDDALLQPFQSDWIHVSRESELIVTVRGPGFVVLYDKHGRIYARLEPVFRGKIRGLCGNMDGSIENDWTSRSGIAEASVGSFAMSYASCNTLPSLGDLSRMEDTCSSAPTNSVNYANKQCVRVGQLPLFHECLRTIVDWRAYRDLCIRDACANPSSTTVCTMIAALAYRCAGRNVLVKWMADPELATYCRDVTGYTCPPGTEQKFSDCMPSSRFCRDFRKTEGGEADRDLPGSIPFGSVMGSDYSNCLQGCACSNELVLNDRNECVPKEKCTCYNSFTGNVFDAGQTAKMLCGQCLCTNAKWNCSGGGECSDKISCPGNQVYMRDVSRCGETCATYDSGTQFCNANEPTYDGCSCPNGTILNDKDMCVQPDSCPCAYNGATLQPGEMVTVGCKKYICMNRRWTEFEEVENCRGVCWASGDPHYKTFDGKMYTYQGQCVYYLVRSKNMLESDLTSFSVTSENIQCGYEGVSCVKAIRAEVNGLVVELTIGRAPTVNGVELPVDPSSIFDYVYPGARIVSNQLAIVVFFYDVGMELTWDKSTRIYVSLSTDYRKQVEGLCGDFDDDYSNDLVINGISVSPVEFGHNWKTTITCPDPTGSADFVQCQNNTKLLKWATRSCEVITKSRLFERCRSVVRDYKQFYENCVTDSCSCEEGINCQCMCTAIASFVTECNSNGVFVDWRSNYLCPIMCEKERLYQPCVSPCPVTCRNAALPPDTHCQQVRCFEGCRCPSNTVLSDSGACVSVNKCECLHGETRFPANTVIEVNCQRCACINGTFVCNGRHCRSNCSADEYRCPGQDRCIPVDHVCDGIVDCQGHEDELECQCKDGEFQCIVGGSCVPLSVTCDGSADCSDGSDELNCEETCRKNEVRCVSSGRCIPPVSVCDGNADCGLFDKTDESNCPDNSVPLQQRLACPIGQHLTTFDYSSDEFEISVNEGKTGVDKALKGSGDVLKLDPADGRMSLISISSQSAIVSLKSLSLVVYGIQEVTFDIDGKGDAPETVKIFVSKSWTEVRYDAKSDQPLNTENLKIHLTRRMESAYVKDLSMTACVITESRCTQPIIVRYSSVRRGDVKVSLSRDGDETLTSQIDPSRALCGGGIFQWPISTATDHTYSVTISKPCTAGGQGSDSRWVVTRISFTVEGAKKIRLLVDGATAIEETDVTTNNPQTFLVSNEFLGNKIQIRFIPKAQIHIIRLYGIEINLCCGKTDILPTSPAPTQPVICDASLSIGRGTSDLADIAAWCPNDSLNKNAALIVGKDWTAVPVERDGSLCPLVVRPLTGCPIYQFEYIGFEIKGTDKIRILIDKDVVFDWTKVSNEQKFERYLQFKGSDFRLEFGATQKGNVVYMRNLVINLCCCNPVTEKLAPQTTCTNRQNIDATSSFDYETSGKANGRGGPIENASLALKYSQNAPKGLVVPTNDAYKLWIQLNEPCSTGLWQIIYYSFIVDRVSRYRITIGTNAIHAWTPVGSSPYPIEVNQVHAGNLFLLEFYGSGAGVMSVYGLQLQVCCPVEITSPPTCTDKDCSSDEDSVTGEASSYTDLTPPFSNTDSTGFSESMTAEMSTDESELSITSELISSSAGTATETSTTYSTSEMQTASIGSTSSSLPDVSMTSKITSLETFSMDSSTSVGDMTSGTFSLSGTETSSQGSYVTETATATMTSANTETKQSAQTDTTTHESSTSAGTSSTSSIVSSETTQSSSNTLITSSGFTSSGSATTESTTSEVESSEPISNGSTIEFTQTGSVSMTSIDVSQTAFGQATGTLLPTPDEIVANDTGSTSTMITTSFSTPQITTESTQFSAGFSESTASLGSISSETETTAFKSATISSGTSVTTEEDSSETFSGRSSQSTMSETSSGTASLITSTQATSSSLAETSESSNSMETNLISGGTTQIIQTDYLTDTVPITDTTNTILDITTETLSQEVSSTTTASTLSQEVSPSETAFESSAFTSIIQATGTLETGMTKTSLETTGETSKPFLSSETSTSTITDSYSNAESISPQESTFSSPLSTTIASDISPSTTFSETSQPSEDSSISGTHDNTTDASTSFTSTGTGTSSSIDTSSMSSIEETITGTGTMLPIPDELVVNGTDSTSTMITTSISTPQTTSESTQFSMGASSSVDTSSLVSIEDTATGTFESTTESSTSFTSTGTSSSIDTSSMSSTEDVITGTMLSKPDEIVVNGTDSTSTMITTSISTPQTASESTQFSMGASSSVDTSSLISLEDTATGTFESTTESSTSFTSTGTRSNIDTSSMSSIAASITGTMLPRPDEIVVNGTDSTSTMITTSMSTPQTTSESTQFSLGVSESTLSFGSSSSETITYEKTIESSTSFTSTSTNTMGSLGMTEPFSSETGASETIFAEGTTMSGLFTTESAESESTSMTSSTSESSVGNRCDIETIHYPLADEYDVPCNPPISVPLTVCRGACDDSSATGAVIAINRFSSRVPKTTYSCSCCADEEGHWETSAFNCSQIVKPYQMYMMTSCSCKECQRPP